MVIYQAANKGDSREKDIHTVRDIQAQELRHVCGKLMQELAVNIGVADMKALQLCEIQETPQALDVWHMIEVEVCEALQGSQFLQACTHAR